MIMVGVCARSKALASFCLVCRMQAVFNPSLVRCVWASINTSAAHMKGVDWQTLTLGW